MPKYSVCIYILGTGRRKLIEQDSPPMDPDSDEENPPVGWPHQSMFIKVCMARC